MSCVTGTLPGGVRYVVLDASDKGCGACHNQVLYVFCGRRLSQTIPADDPRVTAVAGGFRVLQPVRVNSKVSCYPSHAYALGYLWKGATFVSHRRGTVKVQ